MIHDPPVPLQCRRTADLGRRVLQVVRNRTNHDLLDAIGHRGLRVVLGEPTDDGLTERIQQPLQFANGVLALPSQSIRQDAAIRQNVSERLEFGIGQCLLGILHGLLGIQQQLHLRIIGHPFAQLLVDLAQAGGHDGDAWLVLVGVGTDGGCRHGKFRQILLAALGLLRFRCERHQSTLLCRQMIRLRRQGRQLHGTAQPRCSQQILRILGLLQPGPGLGNPVLNPLDHLLGCRDSLHGRGNGVGRGSLLLRQLLRRDRHCRGKPLRRRQQSPLLFGRHGVQFRLQCQRQFYERDASRTADEDVRIWLRTCAIPLIVASTVARSRFCHTLAGSSVCRDCHTRDSIASASSCGNAFQSAGVSGEACKASVTKSLAFGSVEVEFGEPDAGVVGDAST